MQLTIVITQDDLAKLSQSTIAELLALASGVGTGSEDKRQPVNSSDAADPATPSRSPTIVARKSRGTVSMGQVFDTIRQNPGKTTEELVSMMYPSDVGHRVAMNRCQSNITRLIKAGSVERVWEGNDGNHSRLYATKDKKRSQR